MMAGLTVRLTNIVLSDELYPALIEKMMSNQFSQNYRKKIII